MKRCMNIGNRCGWAKMSCCKGLLSLFLSVLVPLYLFTACSTIDEDMSDCGSTVTYDLTLVTNINTEIETQLETKLSTEVELEIAHLLRDYLKDIFTDYAHDVNLSFYDTEKDSIRLHHDEHIMDANQASYTLNLPMREYMHLAAANLVNNHEVSIERDDRCHTSMLHQVEQDTIENHTTGLFTARQPMNVLEGINQQFNVRLYMANCAAALLIDPRGQEVKDMKVYSTGFATSFDICDSTYVYPAKSPIVRMDEMQVQDQRVFCSVNFPSRDAEQTRVVIENAEVFDEEAGDVSLWKYEVYVWLSDGTITKTELNFRESLQAGQFKITKCWIGDRGVVYTEDSEVSTSVTLDWKGGLVIKG